jgi:hypothetical protein
MMAWRPEPPAALSYRHGMRVRVRGRKGILWHCEKRDGSGSYWKVLLQPAVGDERRPNDGEWVWPDGLAVDGPGDELASACASCELPFYRRPGSGELICARCDFEQFGTEEERSTDARSFRSHTFHQLPKTDRGDR